MNYAFRPLTVDDMPLMLQWFNTPHVQEFYSLHPWTLEEVEKHFTPIFNKQKPVFAFIVTHFGEPIGYIQYYRVKDFGWPDQDLPEEIKEKGAGIDFFIGESVLVGKGLGTEVIALFLEKMIWPHFHYCVVDPDIRNKASLHFFGKCGFMRHKAVLAQDANGNPVTLQLMIKQR